MEGNTDVDLEKAKKGKAGRGGKVKDRSRNQQEQATPLLSAVVLNIRYNGVLKLPAGKLAHVNTLKVYIDARGKRWINEVARGQRDAVDQDEPFDQHIVVDPVNWVDEDHDYDYDTVPEPQNL